MQTMEWDDFRLVKVIAEHRALGPAADALRLNHSTVFRKLNALEEQIGTRIFERSRSGYSLTSAGEEMLLVAGQMAEAVFDFERRVAGMDARPTGELRVTTTGTIYGHLLAPIFAGFREHFPGITLEVVVDSRALNLSRRDADVAIRAALEPPDALVGRRIGVIAWAPYATSSHTMPPDGDPYGKDGNWVGFGDMISGSAAGRWLQNRLPSNRFVLSVNSVSSIAASVQSGVGFGILPCFLGDRTERLVRIGEPIKDISSALWILTHADLRRSVRVRAFLDYVGAELVKRRKLIEGGG
ncbi:MAG: LysR family transcriptional regulator [Proteobacteria bacterium]|nr:LysR family transcriptional regulator [Pseudomonadota bacterium]